MAVELSDFDVLPWTEADEARPAVPSGEIPSTLSAQGKRILAGNAQLRGTWDGSVNSYPSDSERAMAFTYYAGYFGLEKPDAVYLLDSYYSRPGKKKLHTAKIEKTLRAWAKGREAASQEAPGVETVVEPGADLEPVHLRETQTETPDDGHPAKDPSAPLSLPAAESLGAFLQRDIANVPSLVGEGLIVEKGLNLLVGPTKKGKTILASQFGLTMAGGLEFWLTPDLIVHGAHRILYLNLELPEPVFEGRLQSQVRQAIDAGYNMQWAWPNFRRVTLRGKLRLDRKDGRAMLTRLVRETKAQLVVIDNLGAAMAVDSNSDERMAPIFLSLYEICEGENVAILLVLHTPKDVGERDEVYWARGSSVQADRADTIITMKPYGNDEQTIQRRIGLTLRCGSEVDPIIVSRQRGSLLWTAGKQKDVRAVWLRNLLRGEKQVAYQEAFESFQVAGHGGERTFRSTLKALAGEIRTQKDGFGGEAILKWASPS